MNTRNSNATIGREVTAQLYVIEYSQKETSNDNNRIIVIELISSHQIENKIPIFYCRNVPTNIWLPKNGRKK